MAQIESHRRMERGLRAFVCLMFLLGAQGTDLLRPLLRFEAHECGCTERICRCLHRHRQPQIPKCHRSAGPPLPVLQSCEKEEAPAVFSQWSLLPSETTCAEPMPAEALAAPADLGLFEIFSEPNPPPPRVLPA